MNQNLALLSNANGIAVGAAQQWFGGAGKVYVSATSAVSVNIEVSVDGGTTWLLDSTLTMASVSAGAQGSFSNPPLLVRAAGQGGGTPIALAVTLISSGE
jgi:hypothetical protein